MFRLSNIAGLLVAILAITAIHSLALAQSNSSKPSVMQANTTTTPQNPDLQTIVNKMMDAQRRNKNLPRGIVVKRDYQLMDKSYEQKARVVANVTYLPPDRKQYEVESSHGGMGEKILRDVLDHETEQKDAKEMARKEFSPENYSFTQAGVEEVDGRRCFVLRMNPKHEEKDMLRGRVWIDAENFNIRRVEGDTAKSPSWWIHDLHILINFSEVDGMWLRTFTQAVANVRFKGRYEMVSRDLEYHPVATQQLVQNRPATNRHVRGRASVVTGAAINP